MSTHMKVLLVVGMASMAGATDPTCPSGYYGKDTECTNRPGCCDPYTGLQCLSKDAYSAYCLPECNPYVHYDWTCTVVPPKTVEPTTVEPTTVEPTTVEPTTVEPTRKEPPSSCPYPKYAKDTECTSNPHCCKDHLKCISKDAYSAYCLPECDPYVHYDWTCTVVPPKTAEPTTVEPTTEAPPSCPYPKYAKDTECTSNPHCCKDHLKCISKDAYSAYCLPECDAYVHYDWTCTVLYPSY